jgi:hypothetical protein
MPKGKSRIYIGRGLQFKVGDMIREHCHIKDGFANYDPSWSDARVLAEFPGAAMTIHHVKSIRLDLVGALAPVRGGTFSRNAVRMDQLESEIAELKTAVAALEKWAKVAHQHDAPFLPRLFIEKVETPQ